MQSDVRTLPAHLKDAGYRVACFGKSGVRPWNFFTWDVLKENEKPIPQSRDHFTFDYVKIARFLTADAGKPFFLVASSHLPHSPHFASGGYAATNRFMDAELGSIVDLLKKHDLEGNTLVVYLSDNGSGVPRAKWTVYDAGVLLPLIVRWPGHVKPRAVSGALVSFVDVAPTLLDAAGVAVSGPPLDGTSFLTVLESKTNKHHDEVFLTQTSLGVNDVTVPYPIRGVRTAEYKYIRNLNPGISHPRTKEKPPAEELYQVEADPGERTNLAARPESRAIKEVLRRKLDAWMKEQGDEGMKAEVGIPVRRKKTKDDND